MERVVAAGATGRKADSLAARGGWWAGPGDHQSTYCYDPELFFCGVCQFESDSVVGWTHNGDQVGVAGHERTNSCQILIAFRHCS